jgi:hypothetical protein
MNQHPDTETDPEIDDQDVEAHSLLVEAQGRELQERRYREARGSGGTQKAASSKASRPDRLRRFLGL